MLTSEMVLMYHSQKHIKNVQLPYTQGIYFPDISFAQKFLFTHHRTQSDMKSIVFLSVLWEGKERSSASWQVKDELQQRRRILILFCFGRGIQWELSWKFWGKPFPSILVTHACTRRLPLSLQCYKGKAICMKTLQRWDACPSHSPC